MRLVFLGCGVATRMHSRTLAGVDRSVQRYYASRDGAKADEYSRRFGGAGSFASYEQALADPGIEVVLVATPPDRHLQLTLDSLNAKKHVIVEKPPFLRLADFNVVAPVAQTVGRQVLVAENYFYKPLLRELRALLPGGAIGDVYFVHINAIKHQRTGDWRDDPARSGGGAMFEGGIHWINFVANLGLPLRAVHGFRAGNQRGPDRSMLLVLEYDGSAVGTLSYSWEVPSTLRGLRISRIYGARGSIAFESNGLFLLVHGRRTRLRLPGLRDMLGYRAMFADFLSSIRDDRPPLFNLELARRDLQLLESIYRGAPLD